MQRSDVAAGACKKAMEMSPVRTVQLLFRVLDVV